MSTVSAVILSAMLSTPLVEVSHDRITETPRVTTAKIVQPAAADIGIDTAAVDAFVKKAAERYTQGR